VKLLKKDKPILKDKERTILRYIDEHAGGCTPNDIAVGTGISYVTVNKYLNRLIKLKIIGVEDGKR